MRFQAQTTAEYTESRNKTPKTTPNMKNQKSEKKTGGAQTKVIPCLKFEEENYRTEQFEKKKGELEGY